MIKRTRIYITQDCFSEVCSIFQGIDAENPNFYQARVRKRQVSEKGKGPKKH